ncbi:MFS transporter [Paenarthrobacter ilicis]|uniref:MFS transporter n=1 Tax=Paenarthrobacter ilicis TaxID=43665 RepID=UPI0028D1B63A|nr:MFS transporter [Paenarthrobacter ilicis]
MSDMTGNSVVPAADTTNKYIVTGKQLRLNMTSAGVGTALEYFDFALYGLAAALVFNPLFFPTMEPAVGLLVGFATFGIGFVARPVGGIIIGYLGDRLGRKWALLFTVGLMGIATTAIGLLPTYGQIGVWAPVLLVFLRILQGFGAGAEIAGGSLLLSEVAPTGRRGIVASVITLGTNAGSMTAAGVWLIVTSTLSKDDLLAWGWRIPFLCSILVMLWTLWMRRSIKESPAYKKNEGKLQRTSMAALYADLFRNGWRNVLVVIGLRIGEVGTSTFYQVFFVGYIATKVSDKAIATQALLIATAIAFVTIPFFGWLSDKIGRKRVFGTLAAFQFLWSVPALLLVETQSFTGILLAMLGGVTVGVVGMASVEGSFLPEIFGARYRYAGLAVSREIGGMVSGGLVPFIGAAILTMTSSWVPLAIYVSALALISFIATLVCPEPCGRDLTTETDLPIGSSRRLIEAPAASVSQA